MVPIIQSLTTFVCFERQLYPSKNRRPVMVVMQQFVYRNPVKKNRTVKLASFQDGELQVALEMCLDIYKKSPSTYSHIRKLSSIFFSLDLVLWKPWKYCLDHSPLGAHNIIKGREICAAIPDEDNDGLLDGGHDSCQGTNHTIWCETFTVTTFQVIPADR